jgi:hypothetical protein
MIKVEELGFDMDELKDEMEECIETAKLMANRLEELNDNIIQYLMSNSNSNANANKMTK